MTAPLTCGELLALGAIAQTHPRPHPDLAARCYALAATHTPTEEP